MNFGDFKRNTESGECSPIYLFEGEEKFYFKRALKLLTDRYLSEPSLNYAEFDEGADISEVIASCNQFPFLSEKRITVVHEFYPKKELKSGEVKDFFDNPSNSGILVILNSEKCEPLKKFPSVTTVDCKKAEKGDVVKYIKIECQKAGVDIDGETAALLGEFCQYDMTRISVETDKLISYAIKDGVINKKDVEELVYRDGESKIYKMTDAIGRKNFDLALKILGELTEGGETPQRLLVSVYNYFRRLLHVAISDKTVTELANLLETSEYPVRIAKEQAKLFKVKSLKAAVDLLSDADYNFKRGKTDIDNAFYTTLFKIMVG